MRKVKITGLPKATQGGASEGLKRFMEGTKKADNGLNQFSKPNFDVNHSISAVKPEEANIEAEGGEQAIVPGQGGIPEAYTISGPRHAGGGVPISLAPDSFIFSDHKKEMKIKDKDILSEFGITSSKKGKQKGFTPASIAKKYDLNDYKKILLDPDSDTIQRETAERMIQNYNMKLGKLALVQESMKGFPQDVPAIAIPYLESIQADPTQFNPEAQSQPTQAAYGAGVVGDPQQYSYQNGGENKAMSKRFPGLAVAQEGGQFSGAFWKSIMQDGGEKLYETEADAEARRMQFVEPEVWNTIYGTKKQIERAKFDAIKDPEAKGLEANYSSPVRDLTSDELDVINGRVNPTTGKPWGGIDPGFYGESAESAAAKEKKAYVEQKAIEKLAGTGNQTVGDKVKTETKPTYKIPSGAIVHEEGDSYNESKVKKGEYVRRKDGKVYQATGKTNADFTYDKLDKIPEKHRDTYSKSYALLNKTLTDPGNKEMTDKLYDNYKSRVSKGKLTQERKDQLMKVPKEDVIKKLMKAQEQIYTINTHAAEDPQLLKRLESGAMDSRLKKDPVTGAYYSKNEAYKDIAKSLGYKEDELLSDDDIAIFQGAYQGLADLSKDTKYKDKLSNFNLKPVGVSDSDWEQGNVSPVDDWFGNTSIGQAATAKEDKMQFAEVELEAKKAEAKKEAEANDPYIRSSEDAPWWAQDIGNMAMSVAERASLKKYLPHTFPVDLAMPDVLYYDPSRALAANAEQANIAAQTIGAFAGPQGTARLSGIQGQAFAQAANTLADYENKNVGVGNQYLANVQATLNKEAVGNAGRMKQFFDETTIANQQFDNSKTAANRNIFDAWRQGLTNATETQTLNSLYPQYNVDPSRGGVFGYTNGRPLTGKGNSNSNDDDYFAEVAAMKRKYPDLDESTITGKIGSKYGKGKEPFGQGDREDLRRFVEDTRRMRT